MDANSIILNADFVKEDIGSLLPVAEARIGGGLTQTVNARDLHGFLMVGKDFSTWVKDRIRKYGFTEGVDFVSAPELSSPISGSSMARSQTTICYHLSLDMAKEVAMVERNEQGKKARLYFIECERRARGQSVTNISPEMRGVIGGIAKGVVLKALNDRLEPVELAVVKLHEMIKEIAAPSGQFKTSKEYTPAVSLADEACVPQRGRGGLVRRMSNRLDRYCRREGIPVRSEAHTDRRLFHVDAAAAWMVFEGRHIIRMHLDRLNGQEVMAFSKKGTH